MTAKIADDDVFQPRTSKGVWVLRSIIVILLAFSCFFRLMLSYRGLERPEAMDQAQIARNLARGEGFTTQFFRPLEVANVAKKNKGAVNFEAFHDTNHAPLNIIVMAGALRLTGYHKFEECPMEDGGSYIYAPDRVISATSMFFFILAIFLSYTLLARMFDEVIAGCSVTLMLLCDLLLDYAASGLPHMLMLCCMLGALHMLVSAIKAGDRGHAPTSFLCICAAYIFLTLMCLSGWMSLWCAFGFLIFCAFYFHPFGSYAIPGFLILGLGLLASAVSNNANTGTVLGNAFYGLYNSFGGGEDVVMRSAAPYNLPLNGSNFALRLIGYTFQQFNTMGAVLGGVVVAPFFLLSLFNRYKRNWADGVKWAAFVMWCSACVGMALYGVNTPYHFSQVGILFLPVFTAFGITLIFNFLGRLKLPPTTFNVARGLALFFIILMSSGTMLANMPRDIYMGIWLSGKGRPQYPPYYPPKLNLDLVKLTNDHELIATDQPWAVAWYADRKALWLPQQLDDYVSILEPIFHDAGTDVQGILITPSSHSPMTRPLAEASAGGMSGVIADMGDFAPLAIEGKILAMVPRHNVAIADMFTENANKRNENMPLGRLVSSRGKFSNRVPLLGAEIMYYCKPNTTTQESL